MSVAPSVIMLAMDSNLVPNQVQAPAKTSDNNTDPRTSTIVPNPPGPIIIFPTNSFDPSGIYNGSEWRVLHASCNEKVVFSNQLKTKILKTKPTIKPMDMSVSVQDMEDMHVIYIDNSDNPKVEKRNTDDTWAIIYKEDRKNEANPVYPTMCLRRYDKNNTHGKYIYQYEQPIEHGLEILTANVDESGQYAAYSDNRHALYLFDAAKYNLETKKGWPQFEDAVLIPHNHPWDAKKSKEDEDVSSKEKKAIQEPPIQSLKFIDKGILGAKTPKCFALFHAGEQGLEYIRCIRAPYIGTGPVSGGNLLMSPTEHKYFWITDGVFEGLFRIYDRKGSVIPLKYSFNRMQSDDQLIIIWMMGLVNYLTKENYNASTMQNFLKNLYSHKALQSFGPAVETEYKEMIVQKATELKVSLK